MTRRAGIVAIAGLLLVASIGGLVLAQETPPDAGGGKYSLAELKQDGRHYSVDGARIVPAEQRVYWLERRPVNQPWRQVSASSNGDKFGSATTLETNSLYLRTIRASEDSETVDVTVAYWNQGTRTVQAGNATREEPVAQNVTVKHQTVTLGPGWALAEIDLPRHVDTTQVTLWLDDYPDTARWQFAHKSSPTTQPIAIDTWGEFLVKLIQFVGLPVLIGGAVVGRRVRSAVESAGIGPQWGFGKWAALITLITVGLAYAAYTALAQAIVLVPYLLGLWLVAIFAAYSLATHRGEIHKKGLLQPDLAEAVSFSDVSFVPSTEADVETDGGEVTQSFGHDILQGEWREFLAIHDDEGMSIVRPGFLPFLARIYGARARIENLHELTARFELPSSSPDEIFFVDPEAEDLIEYSPPGFEFDLPDLSREAWALVAVSTIGAAGLTYQLGSRIGLLAYIGAALIGLFVVAKFYISTTDGFAHIEPAPMHFRQAFASTLMLSQGVADAHTIEDAKRQARMEKLKTRQDAQDDLDDFDRVLMDFLAGDESADSTEMIDDVDQTPPEADESEEESP